MQFASNAKYSDTNYMFYVTHTMLNKEQQLNEAHMAYNFIKALDHVTSVIPYMEMLKFNICMYSKYANEYFRLIKVQHGN